MKNIKRFIYIVLSFAVAGISVFSEGCKKGAGKTYVMPSVPDGVELGRVEGVALSATLDKFYDMYISSDNIVFDYYGLNKTDGEAAELLVKSKYFNSEDFDGGDAVAEINSTVSGNEKISDPVTVNMRNGSYTVLSNGYEKRVGGKAVLKSSGLKGSYRDPGARADTLLKTANESFDLKDIFQTVISCAANSPDLSEVSADSSKLYIKTEYKRGAEERKIILYMDCAASLTKDSFGEAAPNPQDARYVKYYTVDYNSFLNDFKAGRAIELSPQGGGSVENIKVNNAPVVSLSVNFIYDGRNDNTNLNVAFSDGSFTFPEDAFSVLTNKISSNNFQKEKLTLLYFTLEAGYSYTRTEGGVEYRYDCPTELIIDIYGADL